MAVAESAIIMIHEWSRGVPRGLNPLFQAGSVSGGGAVSSPGRASVASDLLQHNVALRPISAAPEGVPDWSRLEADVRRTARPGIVVVLGLEGIDNLDSRGLAAVLRCRAVAADAGAGFGVYHLQGRVRALFERAGLHKALDVFNTAEDARAASLAPSARRDVALRRAPSALPMPSGKAGRSAAGARPFGR